MGNKLRALLLSIALVLPVASHGAMWEFGGMLDDEQAGTMVPGAGGSSAVFYNTETGELEWMIAYFGLTGAPIAAHIHRDSDNGVVVPLDDPHFPMGASGETGMYTGSAMISSDEFNELTDDQTLVEGDATSWYVNIHTAMFGGGEIRGQLIVTSAPAVVPLPGAAWLMIGALGTLMSLRRTA